MLCRVVPINSTLYILAVIKLLVQPYEHEAEDYGREDGDEGGNAVHRKRNDCRTVSGVDLLCFRALLTVPRTGRFRVHIAYIDRTAVRDRVDSR